MKRIILLGASGTIGLNALQIIEKNPELFSLAAVSTHHNDLFLDSIIEKFPGVLRCFSGSEQSRFEFSGPQGILDMISQTDGELVLNGISGSPGLAPSWRSLETNRTLALANKETVVMAGHLLKDYFFKKTPQILPVDSEHSALFYLTLNNDNIQELILTASGGPFLNWSVEDMAKATLKEALKHPSWSMGSKITIDSASMANKGLEVIEAHYLFQKPADKIKVVIHPESIIHSFVRTKDNALYSQMGLPDMALPIQNALMYPEMKGVESIYVEPWDLHLSFEKPDFHRFPMLSLAYSAINEGPASCIAYNAANEVAVSYFMNNRIKFLDIAGITDYVLNHLPSGSVSSIEEVLSYNKSCISFTREYLEEQIASD